MATSVPEPAFTDRGFVTPDESDILAGVRADIDAAFGGGLNPALETPQGQLASSIAAIVGNVDDEMVKLFNSVDPAYASGRYQDAIARIYFISRNPSQPTAVQALCSGLPGVVIPVGALAVASDGSQYQCTEEGTIPEGGSVTLPFACVLPGPTPCPAGSLNSIYQAIPGWDSITNPADGVIGNDVESRGAFEARRAASVAQNSAGFIQSILGAVLNVPGVLDAYAVENDTNSSKSIGGVTLAANSIYVSVYGGDPEAVARAIWSRKAPGASYNGNTTVTVYDTSAVYSAPYPAYEVTFQTADPLAILFAVLIVNGPLVPADAAVQIQNAIIAAFAGADGGARARIGTTLYASRFYAVIAALGPWAQIVSVSVGSANDPSALVIGSIAGATMTVSSVVTGSLAAGHTISGAGVLAGSKILSQLSGPAGGAGTYELSKAQTIASEVLTAAVPDADDVVIKISQVPTVSAENISVTLA